MKPLIVLMKKRYFTSNKTIRHWIRFQRVVFLKLSELNRTIASGLVVSLLYAYFPPTHQFVEGHRLHQTRLL